MDSFLENPLFFFMDNAEPILPIFQSPEYNDSGRIVELADVGCDTENIFPIHFPRGVFDRRRGGAENFKKIRKMAKRYNERPENFSARTDTVLNNIKGKNRANYVGAKKWQNNRNYNDVYIADLDYDSFVEDPYDNFEISKNNPIAAYKDDNYNDCAGARNISGYSGKKSPFQNVRHDHLRDLQSPFSRNNYMSREYDNLAYERENTCSRWFIDSDEKNVYKACNIDVQTRLSPSSKSKNRTKIFSKTDENLNHDNIKFGDNRAKPERWKRTNVFSNAADSVVFPKDDLWNFVSVENELNCDDSTFSNSTRTNKNYSRLQRMPPKNKSLRKFGLQQVLNNSDSMREDPKKTRETESQEDLSSKDPFGCPNYRISRRDDDSVVTDKHKVLRSNFLNKNSARIRSAKISNNERLLDNSTGKRVMINARPRSAFEKGKIDINSSTSFEIKKETTNSTSPRIIDDFRYHDKLNNNLVKSPNELNQSTNISKCVTDSKSNERMYPVKEDDINRCIGGLRINKNNQDRINQVVFPRAASKNMIKNERTFALKITPASPNTEVEKKKKRKFSRLPVRTWKRVRTKEPSALRVESDATNEAVNRKLQDVNIALETINSNKQTVEDRAIGEHDTKKRNDYRRSFNSGISRLASANLKDLKGTKNLNAMEGTTHEQRKERINTK